MQRVKRCRIAWRRLSSHDHGDAGRCIHSVAERRIATVPKYITPSDPKDEYAANRQSRLVIVIHTPSNSTYATTLRHNAASGPWPLSDRNRESAYEPAYCSTISKTCKRTVKRAACTVRENSTNRWIRGRRCTSRSRQSNADEEGGRAHCDSSRLDYPWSVRLASESE